MSNGQVFLVCLISVLIGTLFSLIIGFEWWFTTTIISMIIIGIIWYGVDKSKEKQDGTR